MLCYIIAMNAAQHHAPKLSRNQGQVLSALRKAKEPLSAYGILDLVRVAGISHPPTVYRALNELIQLGMVHRLQSPQPSSPATTARATARPPSPFAANARGSSRFR